MRFQFYTCSTVDDYKVGHNVYEHREVHFVLFGRELQSNEPVAVHFRYCPYLVTKDLAILSLVDYSHYDTVHRMPLHGYAENTIPVHRVFVPMKREWHRVIQAYRKHQLVVDLLDYHHNLSLQMQLVLGLRPLDVVYVNDFEVSVERHTNVKNEYTISTRLCAQSRDDFPLIVSPEAGAGLAAGLGLAVGVWL